LFIDKKVLARFVPKGKNLCTFWAHKKLKRENSSNLKRLKNSKIIKFKNNEKIIFLNYKKFKHS
jgi:hypothetical protein